MDNSQQVVLLMAYGSPEAADDIEAYYTDIRRGHPPNAAQLKQLQDRYDAIGGKTPLLAITREQAKLLGQRLGVRTYVGMKHWHPYITEAVKEIAQSGASQIVALVLAPHYSTMSVADYGARLHRAVSEVDPRLKVTLIERWGDDPVFIDSVCERLDATRRSFPAPSWEDIEVVFTAHSLPERILKDGDPYHDELMQTCKLAASQLGLPRWRLAFQSAGRTADSWIGPDVLEELAVLAASGNKQVLVAPIGFTVDNLEILYDLDIEAAQAANDLGLIFKRIPGANATPRFIDALESVTRPFVSGKPL